jgi:hypothetical protein
VGTTTNYAFPYPSVSDSSNGPAQMQSMAQAIDTLLKEREPLFKRKTVNETVNNTTTLQNDDVLFLTPLVSTVYTLEGFIIYTSNTTPDFKCSFTFPAGASLSWTGGGVDINATAGHSDMAANVAARLTSDSTFSYGGSDAFVTALQIKGTLIMGGTSGNLQFRWTQATANASDTTVYRDSWLRLTKVP